MLPLVFHDILYWQFYHMFSCRSGARQQKYQILYLSLRSSLVIVWAQFCEDAFRMLRGHSPDRPARILRASVHAAVLPVLHAALPKVPQGALGAQLWFGGATGVGVSTGCSRQGSRLHKLQLWLGGNK